MPTIILFVFLWLIVKAFKSIFRRNKCRTRRKSNRSVKAVYTPDTMPDPVPDTKQAEKQRRNELKARQAQIDIDYYSGVLETQNDLITAYNSELTTLHKQIKQHNLLYEMSDNPAAFMEMYVPGFDTEKATKRVEQLTARIQAAQGKAAQASKKIQMAQLIIDMYQ